MAEGKIFHEASAALDACRAGIDEVDNEVRRTKAGVIDLVQSRGGRWAADSADDCGGGENVHINAGGEAFTVPRRFFRSLEGTLVAETFSSRWHDGLLRDSEGRVFLDLHPPAFESFVNELVRHHWHHELHKTATTSERLDVPRELEDDPSVVFVFKLLMQPMALDTPVRDDDAAMVVMDVAEESESAAHERAHSALSDALKRLEGYKRRLEGLSGRLQHLREATKRRVALMSPFLQRKDDGQDEEIVSVTVLGRRVSTRLSTLMAMGEHSTIYNRFRRWSDADIISATPIDSLRLIVDLCRRFALTAELPGQAALPGGSLESGPMWRTLDDKRQELFLDMLAMYNLRREDFCRGPEGSTLMCGGEMIGPLAKWMRSGERMHHMQLLYKASRDGFEYIRLAEKLSDPHRALLILVRSSPGRELLAIHLDGPVRLPRTPLTGASITYVPIAFIKLRGTHERPWTGRIALDGAKASGNFEGLMAITSSGGLWFKANGEVWIGTEGGNDLTQCRAKMRRRTEAHDTSDDTTSQPRWLVGEADEFVIDEIEICSLTARAWEVKDSEGRDGPGSRA
ncbi:unnamed protein product [Vitrella brassicaformis CCMP3155]|uniref:Potassium channel tetramerisation-type BTB domain-containing protein n=3 Tax=Vitrella brassicaformis TaxID=1169539 RepID=A0A0G4G1C7_VITBC|nr:unnamed protein product [Vitrella brassicaformis CCMP3155]|mmetsp:Transcript_15495/g.44283  ORF Transcript_15495/g.44283 Transcript_15495/m.44283 type:complete len:571 (-) Transcript_15495:329-2041(-)|eukprot:CEM21294.1 unnamed protein product [Vitrella brassicaformis CCMP3155]